MVTTTSPSTGAPTRVGPLRRSLVLIVLSVLVVACGGGQDAGSTTDAVAPTSSATAGPSADGEGLPDTAADGGAEGEGEPTSGWGTAPARLDEIATAEAPPPTRVRIPSIGVDVDVVEVGVEPDGAMEVPPAEDAGWYRYGPTPGEAGSSVVAAHVDYDGVEGAFFRLADLAPGAVVEVDDAEGRTVRFTVEQVGQVAKGELRATDAFDRSGPARLTLITCGGDFDRSARSYRDNVVVTAVPEA